MNPREYCFDLDRFLREVFEEHSLEVTDHITHADGYIEILFLYEGIEFECSVSRYSDNRVHITLGYQDDYEVCEGVADFIGEDYDSEMVYDNIINACEYIK